MGIRVWIGTGRSVDLDFDEGAFKKGPKCQQVECRYIGDRSCDEEEKHMLKTPPHERDEWWAWAARFLVEHRRESMRGALSIVPDGHTGRELSLVSTGEVSLIEDK